MRIKQTGNYGGIWRDCGAISSKRRDSGAGVMASVFIDSSKNAGRAEGFEGEGDLALFLLLYKPDKRNQLFPPQRLTGPSPAG